MDIIQWNCQGLRSKKQEILDLIQQFKPLVLAIQESKLWTNHTFRIPQYNAFHCYGHYNRTPHGGVTLLVHDSCPIQEIPLRTQYQAVAARVRLGRRLITICSIYISRSHTLDTVSLTALIRQLPHPLLLLGDFNSYHTIWGCPDTDRRGISVVQALHDQNLILLNDFTPTRVGYSNDSNIDLSIATPGLGPALQWSVCASTFDSDHCPIVLTFLSTSHDDTFGTSRNIKRANWSAFTTHPLWDTLPNVYSLDNPELVTAFYDVLDRISRDTIPSLPTSRFFPRPFWTTELSRLRNKREYWYRRFRRVRSPGNRCQWQRARAEFRKHLKVAKREQWQKLAGSFTTRTPMSQIYENLRKIQGRSKRKISILSDGDREYTTLPEIANKLAHTFSQTSNTSNFPPQFRQHQLDSEAMPLHFETSTNHIYNRDFTFSDLDLALKRTKNTSAGPDWVYYQMIKHFPRAAKAWFLQLVNKFWDQGYIPQQWKEATIVAFPKPGKDHHHPQNYRPIALTSTLGKTVERMINIRLCDYLDMHNVLSSIQCGCRQNRSTIDLLVRLDQAVRSAKIHKEHLVSIFFDLQKAYDTTWRYGILRDLHMIGLRGRLPLYIQEFLAHRYFRVRIGNTYSDWYSQEQGVPQGGVLSVTLFAIKINGLASQIPKDPRFVASLYVDDFQISYRHSDLNQVQDKLQCAVTAVQKWTQTNGFQFSTVKTKALHFATVPGLFPTPAITLYGLPIAYEQTLKFLGLQWDRALSWKPHISFLKAKCQAPLSLLRSISAQDWGADRKILLHLYNLLVRSRLDYGCIVYNSACNTTKALLNPVENEGLRICSGAFKSTPVSSLQVITNQPPLDLRRLHLSLKYYLKLRSHISNPAFSSVVPKTVAPQLLSSDPPPLRVLLNSHLDRLDLRRGLLCPHFSYQLLDISTPSWSLRPLSLNTDLHRLPKAHTNPDVYDQHFQLLLHTTYSNFYAVYTDGSKTGDAVGAAAVSRLVSRNVALPPEASIFAAELHAIHLALDIVASLNFNNYVIFSDSLSALQSLSNAYSPNPLSRKLSHRIHNLTSSVNVHFCWIPGHAGIQGNEDADSEARAASRLSPVNVFLYYKDLYPLLESKIYGMWRTYWQADIHNKLFSIRSVPGPWQPTGLSRKEDVIIVRLRTQHTWLTHNYLMSSDDLPVPPPCPWCDGSILTINHIFVDCPALARVRAHCFPPLRHGETRPLSTYLGNGCDLRRVLSFMRELRIYDLI